MVVSHGLSGEGRSGSWPAGPGGGRLLGGALGSDWEVRRCQAQGHQPSSRDLRTDSSGRREGHTAEDAAAPGVGGGGLRVDIVCSSRARLYQPAQSLELRRCDGS